MTKDDVAVQIKSALSDRLLQLEQPSDKRIYVEVDSPCIADATRILFDQLEGRLQTVSGVDAAQQIELLYHWALDRLGLLVTVRTRLDRDHPQIASITTICPAAEWIERELWELMGVSFPGHPDLRHLLLQDDWPAGEYPLRRDYRRK